MACKCQSKAKAKKCAGCATCKGKKATAARANQAAAAKRLVVFLDRDGVVNEGGRINKASEIKLIKGVAEAIAALKKAGFVVVLTTNQGGLSLNLDGTVRWKQRPFTPEILAEIHAEVARQLGSEAQFDLIKVCPHSVSVTCPCRKPAAGMHTDAAKELNLELSPRSFMVGDKASDIQSGINAGVTPILVLSGTEDETSKCPAGTPVFPSLVEAAQYIIASLKKSEK